MTVFRTAREAFAWLANATRGPRLAQLKLEPRIQESRYVDDWTLHQLGPLVYGPPPTGCGLKRGSALERDVMHWALRKEPTQSRKVDAFARRLTYRLKKHGLKRIGPVRPTTRIDRDEDTGQVRRSAHVDETKPTERQADCLEAVIEYQRANGGVSPSIRELAEAMGLSPMSAHGARDHLLALERKGWIKLLRSEGTCIARGIVVLSDRLTGTPKDSWT